MPKRSSPLTGVARVFLPLLLAAGGAPAHLHAQQRPRDGTAYDAQPPLGPLRVGEKNPIYRLFYVPMGEPADLLGRGRVEAEVVTSYASIYERSEGPRHVELFDFERMTNRVDVRYGVSRRFEVGAAVSLQSNWPGFLDAVIQDYHHALHLPNGDREKVPNGQYAGYLDDAQGAARVSIPRGALRAEDLQLFGKVALVGDGRSAVSLRAAAKLPTGDRATHTGRSDVALEVLGRRSWERLVGEAMVGVGTLRAPPALAPFTSRGAAYLRAGVEGRIHPSLSVLAQFATGSRYLGGFGVPELDRVPTVLSLGAAGFAGSGWRWEASFSEDVPPDGPSVDFSVDVAVSRRW